MFTTGVAVSITVNALVTGLIVFKILKVFLEVKANMTSIEQTLGSTGGTKLQHVLFIIIEPGMALFAIQLIRVMFSNLGTESAPNICIFFFFFFFEISIFLCNKYVYY